MFGNWFWRIDVVNFGSSSCTKAAPCSFTSFSVGANSSDQHKTGFERRPAIHVTNRQRETVHRFTLDQLFERIAERSRRQDAQIKGRPALQRRQRPLDELWKPVDERGFQMELVRDGLCANGSNRGRDPVDEGDDETRRASQTPSPDER